MTSPDAPPAPQPDAQSGSKRHRLRKRMTLMLGSFAFFFVLLEIGYRRVDPYPYFPPWKINRNEHGNLTEYDARLGWRGSPDAQCSFVTQNARVTLAHNAEGFRDRHESDRHPEQPAIVFLGDSFTWGYDVEYNEMFANRVRTQRPSFEIYNFSHRGYGTDQTSLILEDWASDRPLKHVFLMFYENDLADNALNIRSRKNKPQFVIQDGNFVLTNVPVPPNREVWKKGQQGKPTPPPTLSSRLRTLAFKSHLVHALHHRFTSVESPIDKAVMTPDDLPQDAWDITRRLIQRIQTSTQARGGTLCVVRIPSKAEMISEGGFEDYHRNLSEITTAADIAYIDLKPVLDETPLRTYFRDGIHWTTHGHEIVADALIRYLEEQ